MMAKNDDGEDKKRSKLLSFTTQDFIRAVHAKQESLKTYLRVYDLIINNHELHQVIKGADISCTLALNKKDMTTLAAQHFIEAFTNSENEKKWDILRNALMAEDQELIRDILCDTNLEDLRRHQQQSKLIREEYRKQFVEAVEATEFLHRFEFSTFERDKINADAKQSGNESANNEIVKFIVKYKGFFQKLLAILEETGHTRLARELHQRDEKIKLADCPAGNTRSRNRPLAPFVDDPDKSARDIRGKNSSRAQETVSAAQRDKTAGPVSDSSTQPISRSGDACSVTYKKQCKSESSQPASLKFTHSESENEHPHQEKSSDSAAVVSNSVHSHMGPHKTNHLNVSDGPSKPLPSAQDKAKTMQAEVFEHKSKTMETGKTYSQEISTIPSHLYTHQHSDGVHPTLSAADDQGTKRVSHSKTPETPHKPGVVPSKPIQSPRNYNEYTNLPQENETALERVHPTLDSSEEPQRIGFHVVKEQRKQEKQVIFHDSHDRNAKEEVKLLKTSDHQAKLLPSPKRNTKTRQTETSEFSSENVAKTMPKEKPLSPSHKKLVTEIQKTSNALSPFDHDMYSGSVHSIPASDQDNLQGSNPRQIVHVSQERTSSPNCDERMPNASPRPSTFRCSHCLIHFLSADDRDKHSCSQTRSSMTLKQLLQKVASPQSSQSSGNETKTPKAPTRPDTYRCGNCSLVFESARDRDKHLCSQSSVSMIHQQQKILSPKSTKSTTGKQGIYNSPTRPDTYRCGNCSLVFESARDRDKHRCSQSSVSMIHQQHKILSPKSTKSTTGKQGIYNSPTRPDTYRCGNCSLVFESARDRDKHLCSQSSVSMTHQQQKVLSPTSTKSTTGKQGIYNSPTRPDTYRCGNCSLVFESARDRDKHRCSQSSVSMIHQQHKILSPTSTKSTTGKQGIYNSLTRPETYRCGKCSLSFQSSCDRDKHCCSKSTTSKTHRQQRVSSL